MKRLRDVIVTVAVGGLLLAHAKGAGPAGQASQVAAKPNILVILADDLGYGDVRCYNPERGKIRTPNIDRLAADGMRFTDAHSSSSVCSPSRYTLLTGRYHWRTTLQNGIVGVFGKPLIAPDRLTVAGLARQQGYRTACIGKWHLGWTWAIGGEAWRRSFAPSFDKLNDEEAVQVAGGARDEWRKVFSRPIADGPTTRGFEHYFGTDVPNWPPYCFIEDARCTAIPTEILPRRLVGSHLASMPGPAVKDWDLEAILPTLAQRTCASIESSATAQKPFFIYLSLTSPHHPIAVTPEWKGKSGLNAYADFVMQTDALIGQVLDSLATNGVAGNTLVLFTSDNGKDPDFMFELQRLGHYCSGPLRGRKFQAWEGGHRMPFIVRWPGMVQPGTSCTQLVHQADLMATLADILGTKLPENAGEDSFSLLPLLKGGAEPIRQHAVSCAGSGVPTIRVGEWKLILEPDKQGDAQVQLYNLDKDLGETENLAPQNPQRVSEMKALLEKLIANGRSTPGAPQHNDVKVIRYPRSTPTRSPGAGK